MENGLPFGDNRSGPRRLSFILIEEGDLPLRADVKPNGAI